MMDLSRKQKPPTLRSAMDVIHDHDDDGDEDEHCAK
jgi:hypothetical protein